MEYNILWTPNPTFLTFLLRLAQQTKMNLPHEQKAASKELRIKTKNKAVFKQLFTSPFVAQ